MGVKVFYKSPVMWNMILFCIFSVMFLYFQSIYRFDSSILSRDFYLRYINDNWSIIMVSSLTMISLFYDFKRLASFLFALMVSITLAITTYFLFLDFSKLALLVLFFYLLFSFYLFQFYHVELEESYNNPLYDDRDLFLPNTTYLNAKIKKKDQEVADGILTNWSEEGCFILFKEKVNFKGKCELFISFKDYSFSDFGTVVSKTKNGKGVGIKFKSKSREKNDRPLGWQHFYEIMEELGHEPELVK